MGHINVLNLLYNRHTEGGKNLHAVCSLLILCSLQNGQMLPYFYDVSHKNEIIMAHILIIHSRLCIIILFIECETLENG